MEEIVIEQKQSKAFRYLVTDVMLLLISIAVWIIGRRERAVLLWLLGIFMVIVFGIAFIIFLGRVMEHKPLLTITFDGIIDSSLSGSVGFIPFQDIENFTIINNMNRGAIGVIPKDEAAFVKNLSPIRQKLARENAEKNYPPMSIYVDKARDMSLEDIYTLLKKRLDDYSSLYD